MQPDAPLQQALVTTVIDVPLSAAWARLEDFSAAHYYVPRLTATEIVSAQSSGLGAHRRVYSGKTYLEETIIEWNEGSGFVIRLHKGSKPMPPFRDARFVYALSEEGPEQTRVNLALQFLMPLGGVGRWLGANLIKSPMEKQLVQVAAGMKHYYETGELATDADRKRLAGTVSTAPADD
ncbi:hypothetical protein BST95_06585 [Halioglobus japonicus]|nr:SRPBCC family protein [Halioglobus japonicus]AQA17953.1 hypothetical protein BST95_06585 [Halioglobus japonicus]GHD18178.1 hypothetical protein GCM10007052_25510 [Halioglobus japonicus]